MEKRDRAKERKGEKRRRRSVRRKRSSLVGRCWGVERRRRRRVERKRSNSILFVVPHQNEGQREIEMPERM
jgi:hypothetical protein